MTVKFQFKYLVIFLTAVLLLFQAPAYSQNGDNKIDSLLNAKYKPDAPGAVFLIAKNGKPVYRKAFGKANLELDIKMKPEQVFEIGSITKQFTAVAILMLVEQGKLNLDDAITKYIPDYAAAGEKITIHHLLRHTSGIKEYSKLKALRDNIRTDLSASALVDIFKNEPLDFSPGEQYKYCNTGYIILGYIIEKISGVSYEEFIEKNIFQKAGMTNSFYGSHQEIIKNRADGYHDRNGYVNNEYISMTLPYAAGSLMSTVDDMLKWQLAINDNILLKKEITEKLFTNYTLNNGEKINYGYGWQLKEIAGIKDREHGGSIFGFKSMGVYLPAEDVYVIALTNCDCNSPTEITREIAAIAIGKPLINIER